MDTNYSNREWDALDNKIEHPEHTVICPRCGNIILYASVGNCCKVRCATDGCIEETVRGL